MRKFLAISWSFPPVILPRSLQVSRTLKSLKQAGWHPAVLTVDPHSIARVFKADPALGEAYQGVFETTAVPSPEDTILFRALWRLFPALSLLPDPRSVWIPSAVNAGRRLLKKGMFSGIFSFAQPWSDHLIARRLSAEFGLPWIAHFSDPWSDSPYYPSRGIAHRVQKQMEESVIRDASAVVFVSEETRNLVMHKYPSEWALKTAVIPHCYEPLDMTSRPSPSSTSILKVVYTGGFYGRRTPLGLLKALAILNQTHDLKKEVMVELVGPNAERYENEAAEMGLRNIVRLSSTVPFKESQDIASRADVLLVIDAPSDDVNVFLPSKVVDYLAFQKPILGITPLKGATADLLRGLDCPLVDPEDIPGIATALLELSKKKLEGKLAVSPEFQQTARRYDIRRTTKQYLELLDRHYLGRPTG